jgi:hypothetical protein
MGFILNEKARSYDKFMNFLFSFMQQSRLFTGRHDIQHNDTQQNKKLKSTMSVVMPNVVMLSVVVPNVVMPNVVMLSVMAPFTELLKKI